MLLSSGQIKGERKLVRFFVAKLSTKIQTKRQKEGARKQNMLFTLFDHDPVRNVFLRNNSFLSFRENFDRPIDSIPIKYQTRKKQIIIRKIFAFKTPAPPFFSLAVLSTLSLVLQYSIDKISNKQRFRLKFSVEACF